MEMKRARRTGDKLLISVEAMSGPRGKNFVTRDTVHGLIEGNPNEKAVINSPLVQRLRRVGQLSLVNYVFNGGNHTRLEHSLGVMHIAGLYMEHIFRDDGIRALCKMYPAEHYIQVARLAGLLHDVGHGPYSHSWDHVVGKAVYGVDDGGHDFHRLKLVDHEILKPHIEGCGVTPDELKTVWNATIANKDDAWQGTTNVAEGVERQLYWIIHAIVEGPLGADRMDFTRRDAKLTGTEHLGTIAQERIIMSSRIVVRGSEHLPELYLAYDFKCIDDITRALDGRLCLYKNVYFHKTSMAASILIEQIIECCFEALDLEDKYQTASDFAYLDDEALTGLVSSPLFDIVPAVTRQSMSMSSGTISRIEKIENGIKKARQLTLRLKNRDLPKLVHEEQVFDMDREYDEYEYRQRWFPRRPSNKYAIIKTRPIAAIDPQKFDKYSCCFYENGKAITCKNALEKIRYTASQPPYYLVRGYEL